MTKEKAVLVNVELSNYKNKAKGIESEWIFNSDDSFAEFKTLAENAGVEVITTLKQTLDAPNTAFFIGSGKVNELVEKAKQADVVIFNQELKSAQQRNLEKACNIRVIDRTQLILDIFAKRARSREGKLQVELAQLQYLLPRLSGKGKELSQLGAGVGTRGPGEQKLEYDRRRVKSRISDLEKAIDEVSKQRELHREARRFLSLPVVSLVGYTNAGKSSLMNALTDAKVEVEDKLFCTLDPATRKLAFKGGRDVLITDTVGFIQDLPHHLIASFRATLEQVRYSDLLIHVIDVSSPFFTTQIKVVEDVLLEISASDKPIIKAYNKIDRLSGKLPSQAVNRFEKAVAISAKNNTGIDFLKKEIESILEEAYVEFSAEIPYDKGKIEALIHKYGKVIKKEFKEKGVKIKALVSREFAEKIRKELER